MQAAKTSPSSRQEGVRSLIEQVMLVGLAPRCQLRDDGQQLRWITSLRIAPYRHLEEHPHEKIVDIGNHLCLQVRFCEKEQRPITKIKSCLRNSYNQDQLLPWPGGVACEEGLLTEQGTDGRIIEDLEMVEVTGERELELPEEQSYEIIRLPSACQTVPEDNSSNEQLIEKTRYLLVRTLDLDDHIAVSQAFQPSVTLRHAFRPAPALDPATFPDFCFPEGVALINEVAGTGYQVLSFILTQEDNSRVYVNCLKFKERLPAEVVETLPANCVDRHLRDRTLLYAERAFCIISKYCHTDFFHSLLEEVFRQYLTVHNALAMRSKHEAKSSGSIPLEVGFDRVAALFIDAYERGLREAQCQRRELEFMGESLKVEMEWFGKRYCFPEAVEEAGSLFSPRAVYCLFSVLSVDRVAEVFLALLQERKVFFVSDSQIVLGYVIEALLSFLYPLRWEHVILPILPQKLLQLLDAPVPLIAGIPTALATDDLICSAKETTVVFLDCNEVISKDRGVQVKEVNHLREAVKKLRAYDIYSKDHVLAMLSLKDQFFLFRISEKENQSFFSAQHIKHIFFETMLLFLQDYHVFYAPVAMQDFTFKRDYQVDQFVRSHPRSLHSFMRRLSQTTQFINFVYSYHHSADHAHKPLIDRALAAQKHSRSPSPIKHSHTNNNPRLSEQPPKNNTEINNLRKKVSLQPHHNTTWSPPPKKSQEVSTNYTRNFDRCSIRLQDVEVEKERSQPKQEQQKKSKGGQICETITKALTNASHTRRNVIFWTQARVARLKRIFTGVSKQPDMTAAEEVKVQQGRGQGGKGEGGSGSKEQ